MWASERGERRPLRWTLHAEREDMEHWPVVPTAERWLLRWLYRFLPWLLELFHSLLPMSWVFYSRAEQHPPRWLSPSQKSHPRCRYSWSISQLPSGCIWLHVQEYWHLWDQFCYLKVTVKHDLSTSCKEYAGSFFCLLKTPNRLFHIFPSYDFQIPFLFKQISNGIIYVS